MYRNSFRISSGKRSYSVAELNGYLEANNYTEFTVGLLDPMKARFPMVILVAIYCIFIAAKLAPEKPVVNITEMESKKDQKKPFRLLKKNVDILFLSWLQ